MPYYLRSATLLGNFTVDLFQVHGLELHLGQLPTAVGDGLQDRRQADFSPVQHQVHPGVLNPVTQDAGQPCILQAAGATRKTRLK